jgi:hypothetical protein
MTIDIDFLPAISKVVAAQDIAMEDFRKAFKLVADCNVLADGKLMTYQLKSTSNMTTWLSCANSIIITHKLRLVAKIRSVMKPKEVVRVELRIVFKPN